MRTPMRKRRSVVRVSRGYPQQILRPNWRLGLALVAILAAGCATIANSAAVDTTAVNRLLGLIKERLDVAPEVARTKWNTKAPIDDPLRDKQIIDGVAIAATEYGLDPQVASTFFIAQIEASKAVQNALHAEWTAKRQPPFAKVADLGKDIRPVLDRLTPAMTRALLEALSVLQRRGGRQLLEAQARAVLSNASGGDTAVRKAVAPLLALSK
jgi:chorismate mutase